MIEAKDKEQAVLELYRIYDLYPVAHDSLRPPADDITTATSGRRKTLNGSGGAKTASKSEDEGESDLSDPDDDSPKKKKPKARKPTEKQIETEKIRKTIEHSKRIAAKRSVPYTGPEFIEPGSNSVRLAQGPILSTAETIKNMEKEADYIREVLRRGDERGISEIRGDVEGTGSDVKQEKPEGDGDTTMESVRSTPGGKKRQPSKTGKTTQKKKKAAATSGSDSESSLSDRSPTPDESLPGSPSTAASPRAAEVPEEEIMQDATEHDVPGEEERVAYRPMTPTPNNESAAAGQPTLASGRVIIPTSAENAERYL